MDRDYMHEERRQRPFSPPPDRFSTLSKVLIFVAILFLLYQVADWKLKSPVPALAAKQQSYPQSPSELPAAVRRAAPASPHQAAPSYDYPQTSESSTRTVTKCVVNGKTSYGDGACAQGAVASRVTTRNDHNLMAAVRPSANTDSETTFEQTVVVTQSGPALNSTKLICANLDEQIKRLDAMARQPQGAQRQDWISAEKKKLRDQQFRIPCQ
ncbi:hypothetical protein [Polaromonas sp. OV174]|uniref:hypothetical protein n=1 Tax=Polaromonas sp. OV174 TaxID=1855300 RepID=UPI0015A5BA67|nr:hypothetical protein [Polaromonas sp. OV174]